MADTKLILAPEVEEDLAEAYEWYEQQRLGLGEEFLSCIDASIQTIHRSPQMYEMVYESYRRNLVRRFPYAIFYEYIEDSVIVYCVANTSQNPQKWRRRLP